MKSAIYAGSFDPFTNGHLSIVKKALTIFDHLHIMIANNPNKVGFLDTFYREMAIRETLKANQIVNAEPVVCQYLVAQLAGQLNVCHLVRGLRPCGDFENEYNMARINQDIAQDYGRKLETVFILADPYTAHVSSSLVRELYGHGGDIRNYVSQETLRVINSVH